MAHGVCNMLIGIDPGMSGAIVVRANGWVWIYDIPTVKTSKATANNKKAKNDYDFHKLHEIICSISKHLKDGEKAVVVCEHSSGMAFKKTRFREERSDDSKTAWKIGYGFGVVRALFALYGLDFTYTLDRGIGNGN